MTRFFKRLFCKHKFSTRITIETGSYYFENDPRDIIVDVDLIYCYTCGKVKAKERKIK